MLQSKKTNVKKKKAMAKKTPVKNVKKLNFVNKRKRLTLVAFMLMFAGLGAFLLIRSFAAPDVPRDKATWDKLSGALKQCESGNNPTIHNSTGKYHGLYQFDLSTWNSYRGGISGADDAHKASVAEQDAVAFKLFQARGLQPWEGKCADQAAAAYRNAGTAPSQTPTSGGGGSSYGCDNHPTIRQSSTGGSSCVKHLQDHLNKYGAGLVVDGAWGTRTTTAVKNFQSSKGLAADGVVGPNTWNALHAGTSTGTQTSTDGRIQGIKFGGGDNILSLEREGTGQRTFINSNSDGSYFFNNLSTPGTYIVRVNPQSGKSIRWTACGNRVGSCHDNPDAQGTGAEAKVYFGGPGYIDLWFHFN